MGQPSPAKSSCGTTQGCCHRSSREHHMIESRLEASGGCDWLKRDAGKLSRARAAWAACSIFIRGGRIHTRMKICECLIDPCITLVRSNNRLTIHCESSAELLRKVDSLRHSSVLLSAFVAALYESHHLGRHDRRESNILLRLKSLPGSCRPNWPDEICGIHWLKKSEILRIISKN